MTEPLEEWYRAAIAETMRPCPQWHEGPRAVRKPSPKRALCPVCGREYAASNLRRHVKSAHPQVVDEVA